MAATSQSKRRAYSVLASASRDSAASPARQGWGRFVVGGCWAGEGTHGLPLALVSLEEQRLRTCRAAALPAPQPPACFLKQTAPHCNSSAARRRGAASPLTLVQALDDALAAGVDGARGQRRLEAHVRHLGQVAGQGQEVPHTCVLGRRCVGLPARRLLGMQRSSATAACVMRHGPTVPCPPAWPHP